MICTPMLIAYVIEEAEAVKEDALKMYPHVRYHARRKIQDLADELPRFGYDNRCTHMITDAYGHLINIQKAIQMTENAERMRGR